MVKALSLFAVSLALLHLAPSNALAAYYFYNPTIDSEYANQTIEGNGPDVNISVTSYLSETLFKTYQLCPYVYSDYGDYEYDGYCINISPNSFNDCYNYSCYKETVNLQVRMVYPGANNVSCYIYGDKGIQWCDGSSVRINYTGDKFPVYRFWSNNGQHHFYTIEHTEKRLVMDRYDDNTWKYEQIAWSAKKFNGVACESGYLPIFRFWSDAYKGHFFTNNQAEKDHIQRTYPTNVWRYEGVSYCATPYNGSCPEFEYPVYRFWSDEKRGHFFTISSEEKDHIQRTYPTNVWRYEGIAYCASY